MPAARRTSLPQLSSFFDAPQREQGRAAGSLRAETKNSPVRKGWGRLEQGEYDHQAAFPFFIPRGMMHTAGIAMPGISVYRLAAGAATGAAAGDGLLPSGKRGPCGTGVPGRAAMPPARAPAAVQKAIPIRSFPAFQDRTGGPVPPRPAG